MMMFAGMLIWRPVSCRRGTGASVETPAYRRTDGLPDRLYHVYVGLGSADYPAKPGVHIAFAEDNPNESRQHFRCHIHGGLPMDWIALEVVWVTEREIQTKVVTGDCAKLRKAYAFPGLWACYNR